MGVSIRRLSMIHERKIIDVRARPMAKTCGGRWRHQWQSETFRLAWNSSALSDTKHTESVFSYGENNDSVFVIHGKYWALLPDKMAKHIQYFPNNDSVFSIAENTDSVFLIPGTCWISMFEIYRPVRKTHCVHKWRAPRSHCRACQLRLWLIYHRYTSLCRPPSPQTPIWKARMLLKCLSRTEHRPEVVLIRPAPQVGPQ